MSRLNYFRVAQLYVEAIDKVYKTKTWPHADDENLSKLLKETLTSTIAHLLDTRYD